MNFEINENTIEKILGLENGRACADKLISLAKRANTEYCRGIVHGYLLTLTTLGVLDNDDALGILEQIDRGQ